MTDLPRVTAILQSVGLGPDLSRIPEDVLETARDRGTAVHAAIEAITYGYHDAESVPPAIAPYLDAYQKFVAESGFEAKYAEIEVTHPTWRYRGHPDLVGFLLGRRVILDAKTGGAEGVEYQLAGYRMAWNAERPTEPVDAIASLLLRRNGTYRLVEHSAAEAEPVFLAAATVFYALKRRAA